MSGPAQEASPRGHRALGALAIVSAVLFTAGLLLAIRSAIVADRILWQRGAGTLWFAQSYQGELVLRILPEDRLAAGALVWESRPAVTGVVYRSKMPPFGAWVAMDAKGYAYGLEYWFVILLAAIAPIRWAWVWYWRPGRRKDGVCAGCGYDLTGNVSGVCPECGKPVTHR